MSADDIPPAELHARRLKAARMICGIDSAKTFADRLALPGLGFKTLANVEAAKRELKPQEIAAVAEFCGLPRTFFAADRAQLGPTSGEVPDDIAERLDRIERLVSGEVGDSHGDATP